MMKCVQRPDLKFYLFLCVAMVTLLFSFDFFPRVDVSVCSYYFLFTQITITLFHTMTMTLGTILRMNLFHQIKLGTFSISEKAPDELEECRIGAALYAKAKLHKICIEMA